MFPKMSMKPEHLDSSQFFQEMRPTTLPIPYNHGAREPFVRRKIKQSKCLCDPIAYTARRRHSAGGG